MDISLYIIRAILQNILVCNGENSRFMTAARTTDFYRFVSSLSYHRQGRKMMIDSLVESLFHNKLQSVPMYNRENITDITDFLTDFHGFLPNICYI